MATPEPCEFELVARCRKLHDLALGVRDFLMEALDEIAQQQPKTLEKLRAHGIVFDYIGDDPTNWQHVAWAIYNDLCEVDAYARRAIEHVQAGLPDPARRGAA